MANQVATLNGIDISKIGSVDSIIYSKIADINRIPFVSSTIDLSTGLVAYFTFDETTGNLLNRRGKTSMWRDGSVNELYMTGVPSYSQSGKYNTAFGFNGVDEGVDFGLWSYDLSLNMTISMWVYDSNLSGAHSLFTRYYAAVGYRCWWLGTTNASTYFSVYDTANTATTIYHTTPISLNTWTHVVATKNGSEIALYLNDVSVRSFSAPVQMEEGATNNPRARIACYTQSGKYWSGRIDETAVWDRGLTPEEVAYLYNSGAGRYYTLSGGWT